jgi:hypothetical protein
MDDAMTEDDSEQFARILLQQGKINSAMLSALVEVARLSHDQGNADLIKRIKSILSEIERQLQFMRDSKTLGGIEPLWESEKNDE